MNNAYEIPVDTEIDIFGLNVYRGRTDLLPNVDRDAGKLAESAGKSAENLSQFPSNAAKAVAAIPQTALIIGALVGGIAVMILLIVVLKK